MVPGGMFLLLTVKKGGKKYPGNYLWYEDWTPLSMNSLDVPDSWSDWND